jgi:hypothetical protein
LPDARVIEVEQPVLPGEARNLGLAHAKGTVVSFPGSHVVISPGSLARRLAAHQMGFAMVTGAFRNGNKSNSGWAAYFLDLACNLPGLPAGPLSFPPITCSYDRFALEWAGGFPEWRTAEDTEVNQRLWLRGYGAYREPAMELVHRNPCSTVSEFLRKERERGRGFGRIMRSLSSAGRLRTRSGVKHWVIGMMPPMRMFSIVRYVWLCRQRDLQKRFLVVSPLVFVGAFIGWAQAWWSWATSQRTINRNETARPAPPTDMIREERVRETLDSRVDWCRSWGRSPGSNPKQGSGDHTGRSSRSTPHRSPRQGA